MAIPHRRLNILTGNWILCSPHRALRPWLGQIEKKEEENIPSYDPKCFLCPGNKRAADGQINPRYEHTFVFENDFSALLSPSQTLQFDHITTTPDSRSGQSTLKDQLMMHQSVNGVCRVVCFSPKHSLTLAEMDLSDIIRVVETWTEQYEDLGKLEYIHYVQIFENKGAMMGCSNPHPHCQIWASSHIPQEPSRELECMSAYLKRHNSCMLCDYANLEHLQKERVICENQNFLAVVPYWALWPYEVLVLSKIHLENLSQFSERHRRDLADVIKNITCRYDNLFQTSFPYSMGIHQSPTDGKEHKECHFHMHFYPPLLRSATIKKHMVGYEMLGEPQRDITAEQSASKLNDLSALVHYKSKL